MTQSKSLIDSKIRHKNIQTKIQSINFTNKVPNSYSKKHLLRILKRIYL